MRKIWFLYINNQQEGPFSYSELSKDERLCPETYAWKEGMEDWLPISEIEELRNLVEYEEVGLEDKPLDQDELTSAQDEELVLEMNIGYPSPSFWILLVLVLLFYAFYEYFWWR